MYFGDRPGFHLASMDPDSDSKVRCGVPSFFFQSDDDEWWAMTVYQIMTKDWNPAVPKISYSSRPELIGREVRSFKWKGRGSHDICTREVFSRDAEDLGIFGTIYRIFPEKNLVFDLNHVSVVIN